MRYNATRWLYIGGDSTQTEPSSSPILETLRIVGDRSGSLRSNRRQRSLVECEVCPSWIAYHLKLWIGIWYSHANKRRRTRIVASSDDCRYRSLPNPEVRWVSSRPLTRATPQDFQLSYFLSASRMRSLIYLFMQIATHVDTGGSASRCICDLRHR